MRGIERCGYCLRVRAELPRPHYCDGMRRAAKPNPRKPRMTFAHDRGLPCWCADCRRHRERVKHRIVEGALRKIVQG